MIMKMNHKWNWEIFNLGRSFDIQPPFWSNENHLWGIWICMCITAFWRKNYCATLYSINHGSLLWTIVSCLYYFNSFHLVSFISCARLLIFDPVSLISQLLFWIISSRWTASTGARCLKALISGPHLKMAITIPWFGESGAELCNCPSTD